MIASWTLRALRLPWHENTIPPMRPTAMRRRYRCTSSISSFDSRILVPIKTFPCPSPARSGECLMKRQQASQSSSVRAAFSMNQFPSLGTSGRSSGLPPSVAGKLTVSRSSDSYSSSVSCSHISCSMSSQSPASVMAYARPLKSACIWTTCVSSLARPSVS